MIGRVALALAAVAAASPPPLPFFANDLLYDRAPAYAALGYRLDGLLRDGAPPELEYRVGDLLFRDAEGAAPPVAGAP